MLIWIEQLFQDFLDRTITSRFHLSRTLPIGQNLLQSLCPQNVPFHFEFVIKNLFYIFLYFLISFDEKKQPEGGAC